MTQFRKKPVVITAITFDQLVAHGIAADGNVLNGMPWSFAYSGHPITHENDDCYLIPTLEGTMKMGRDDMLITGVKGEIYPCKRDIFEATYDPAPTVLPVVDPGPDSLERAHAEAHASAVLYPAIKAAMEELQTLHPGFNDAVNRAFNLLHDAFWSECPAPAGASPRRSVGEAAPDFLTGKTACSMAGEGACEACQ